MFVHIAIEILPFLSPDYAVKSLIVEYFFIYQFRVKVERDYNHQNQFVDPLKFESKIFLASKFQVPFRAI